MTDDNTFDEARYRRTARRTRRFEDKYQRTGLSINFLGTLEEASPILQEMEHRFLSGCDGFLPSIAGDMRAHFPVQPCVILRWITLEDGTASQDYAGYFLLRSHGNGGASISHCILNPEALDPDRLLEYLVNWLEAVTNETASFVRCEFDNPQRGLLRLHLPYLGLEPIGFYDGNPVSFLLPYTPNEREQV